MRAIARFCVLVAVVLTVALAGCEEAKRTPTPPGQTVKVHVSNDGKITYDGATVSKDELKSKLTALKSANGAVQFSADKDAAGVATPHAAEVLVMITDAGINPLQ